MLRTPAIDEVWRFEPVIRGYKVHAGPGAAAALVAGGLPRPRLSFRLCEIVLQFLKARQRVRQARHLLVGPNHE
jgi:hypothetical protein